MGQCEYIGCWRVRSVRWVINLVAAAATIADVDGVILQRHIDMLSNHPSRA